MENNNLSLDEKIDYVYTYIKKVERRETINLYLKWIFRFFILIYVLYFVYFSLPGLIDIVKGMVSPGNVSVDSMKNINPETLEKLKLLLK